MASAYHINWKFWWWRIALFVSAIVILELLAYSYIATNTIVVRSVEIISGSQGYAATQLTTDKYFVWTDVRVFGLLFLPSCTLLTLYAPLVAGAYLLKGNLKENSYIFALFVGWWYFIAVLRSVMIDYVYIDKVRAGWTDATAWNYAHNVIGNSVVAYMGVAVLIISLTYLFAFSERYGYYAELFEPQKNY